MYTNFKNKTMTILLNLNAIYPLKIPIVSAPLERFQLQTSLQNT